MSRCRICHVVNNLNVGGLEKVVVSLVQNLDRQRFEPFLICLDGKGTLFDQAGLPPHRTLVLDKSQALDLRVARFDPRMLLGIGSFVRQHRLDVVHTHNAAPLIYGGLGSRLSRSRPQVIYSEHNQIYSASPRGKRRFRFYVRLADHVVAVSRDLRHSLAEEAGVRGDVRVIHNGIDGRRFQLVGGAQQRDEWGVAADELVVGTGVVLSKQKGIRYLLEAAKAVIARQPRVRFVIAGDGPLRADLERQAAELGIADRVTFLGYRDDMPEVISALDLYVLPSLWEGLPLGLLEALAIGKPIVATRVGGVPEVVEHGVNGYLVAPRDVNALAEHILRVLSDEAFRKDVSVVNRRTFDRDFSLAAMVGAHERLYDEVRA